MTYRTFILTLGLFAAFTPRSPAQNFSWTGNAGSGDWNVPANWSTNVVPASASNTVINLTGTNQTDTNQNVSAPFQFNRILLNAAATGGFTVSGGTLQFAGANNTANGNITVAGSTTGQGLSISAPVDFGTGNAFTINVQNNIVPTGFTGTYYSLVFAGPVSAGAGTAVTKLTTNGGNLNPSLAILSANNAFAGTFNNSQGNLTLVGVNALGRSAAVNTGTSVVTSSVILGTPAGSGYRSVGGTFTFASDVGAAQQFGSLAGQGSVQFGTTNAGAAALTGFDGTPTSLSGLLQAANTASHLGQVGSGTFTCSGNSSSYNGSLSVRDGNLTVTGSSGQISGANMQAATVYAGATLQLDNNTNGNNASNRVGTGGVPLNLAGGSFAMDADGNNFNNSAQTFGTLAVQAGQSTVALTGNGQNATLTFASGSAGTAAGTVFFRGDSLGAAAVGSAGTNVIFTAAPSQIGGIIPWGLGSSTGNGATPDTFVTVGANGVRPMTTGFSTTIAGGGNVRVTAPDSSAAGGSTVNSLITTGQNVTLSGNLTVTSGALLNTNAGAAAVSGAGTLLFGAGGASTAYVTASGNLTLSAPVSAANFSKNGSAAVTLQSAVSLGSNATVTVNAGTLAVQAGGSFAASGGTLTYQVAKGATLDASGAGGLTLGPNQTLTGNGTVAGLVTVGSGGAVSPNALSGPGTLTAGNMTWQSNGKYVWAFSSALSDASGNSPYTSSKISSPTGTLDLTGISGTPLVVQVVSLKPDNTAGSVYDFDLTKSYSWTLASFGTINNFAANKFAVDASQFANSPNVGGFVVGQNGNNVILTFTPVPEPATVLALSVAGLGAVVMTRRLRRVTHGPIETERHRRASPS